MRPCSGVVAALTLLALASAAEASTRWGRSFPSPPDPIASTAIDVAGDRGTTGGARWMPTSNTFRPVDPAPAEAPIEPVDDLPRPELPPAPVEPPPILEEPQVVFTDGPCPPGYYRVSVDAVDAEGRFTTGFSYCERRVPERSKPAHEGGPGGDRGRPAEP